MDGVRVAIDSGGTFTDAVALDPAGELHVAKVPSTPHDPAVATVAAYKAVTRRAGGGELRHGTTVPTNALLERRGARTALVTTRGFADVVEIGRQRRPDLFDIAADRPPPLVPPARRFEAAERVDHAGEVLLPLVGSDAAALCDEIKAAGVEAVALSLLHSYANPEHEQMLSGMLEEALAGSGTMVVASSQVAAEFREYERTSTTVMHAYLGPGTAAYLRRLAGDPEVCERILVMRSAGGMCSVDVMASRPADALLSGPAAGALAAAAVATAAGYTEAIGFDMGGTSTDVCLVQEGRPELRSLTTVGGLPCLAPALAIHTVGAGGGSIAALDPGGALEVGPRSAGADPGPACYGRGGDVPTVTDANVALGRIPHLVGGEIPLDVPAAVAALGTLGQEAAEAVLAVVEATMERAMREVSVQRGVDPAGCALVAFGGAGGLHAAALCRALGAPCVLLPPHAGVLSAVGLLAAPVRADRSLTHLCDAADFDTALLRPLVAEVIADLEGLRGSAPVSSRAVVDCRYRGQSHEVSIPVDAADDPERIVQKFHRAHDQLNGYRRDGADVQIVTLRAEAEVDAGVEVRQVLEAAAARLGSAPPTVLRDASGIARLRRDALAVGFVVEGPAVVADLDATTWVPDDFVLRVDPLANLVLEQA